MIRTKRSRRLIAGLDRLEGRELLADGSLTSVWAAQVTSMPALVTSMPAVPQRLTEVFQTPPTVTTAAPVSNNPPTTSTTVSTREVSPTNRSLVVGGSVYSINLTGSGFVRARMGRNGLIVSAIGTDSGSTLSIVPRQATHATRGTGVSIARLTVRSNALGTLNAPVATLNGPASGLEETLQSVVLGGVGRNGVLNVGNVQNLSVGGIQGRLTVGGSASTLQAGNVTGSLEVLGAVGTLGLGSASGTVAVDGPVTALQAGNISGDVDFGGSIGAMTIGALSLGTGQRLHVAGDVTGNVSIGAVNLNGGQVSLDRDVAGSVSLNGDLKVSSGSRFVVGRDLGAQVSSGTEVVSNGVTIDGNVTLETGGELAIGRDVEFLSIDGNLDTSGGGRLSVGGDLGQLEVTGRVKGRLDRDIVVGLDLGSLVVQGAAPNAGGIDRTDIDVGKSLLGVDVVHGIFTSKITAGVQIVGGTTPNGFNVGPDGPVAIYNSLITAGQRIDQFRVLGDVKSDRPTNPTGLPTRIIAGVDRAGKFTQGGAVDNFVIDGILIDSVIAASVKPNGGNGALTTTAGDAPGGGGSNTYDAPGGTITGSVGTPLADGPGLGNFLTFSTFNYTAPPYNPTVDPTIDDSVLAGSINASFAPSLVTNPTPFPSKNTVTAGVISTPHGDEFDYAGFFASDTSGVYVGVAPK